MSENTAGAVPKPGPPVPKPSPPGFKPAPNGNLRTVVVMDYQNVHLVGRNRFRGPAAPAHESLIHPLRYAQRLISDRNANQRPGYPQAVLSRVEVFRGQPDANHEPTAYARNSSQTIEWRSPGPPEVRVTNRTLKYQYLRDAQGWKIKDIHGKDEVDWSTAPSEKGVDVLCALAVYQATFEPNVDLVILASIDSDLVPALHAAQDAGRAKIETACWGDRSYGGFGQLRVDKCRPSLWNTALSHSAFEASIDPKSY